MELASPKTCLERGTPSTECAPSCRSGLVPTAIPLHISYGHGYHSAVCQHAANRTLPVWGNKHWAKGQKGWVQVPTSLESVTSLGPCLHLHDDVIALEHCDDFVVLFCVFFASFHFCFAFTAAAVKTSLKIKVEGGAIIHNREISLVEAGRKRWKPASGSSPRPLSSPSPPLLPSPPPHTLPHCSSESSSVSESQGSSWERTLKPLN